LATEAIEESWASIDLTEIEPWLEEELQGIDLKDKRLNWRIKKVAVELAAQPTAPINQACEDHAATKAAYRLFANENVMSEQILKPVQENTAKRMAEYSLVLAVQDTTTLNFTSHPKTEGLGPIASKKQTLRGLIMHSTLAYTPEGMPLGILAQETWARSDEKKSLTAAERKRVPIEEKESYKWLTALKTTVALTPAGTRVVTVCDREADIYELFVEAHNADTGLLVRATQDRVLMDAQERHLWDQVSAQFPVAELKVDVPAKKKEPAREAIVSVRFCSVKLKPPQRPVIPGEARLPAILLDAVLVREVDAPEGVTPLEWMLLTNVPVRSAEDAVERVEWYRVRWAIEIFHRVLKSGCKVEDCRLGTKDRLLPYLTLSSVIAWRMYWLTHVNRHEPDAPCSTILAEHEWRALYAKSHRTVVPPQEVPTVRQAVRWIAQLGGFLGRKGDGEPGPTVTWRGWERLNDIADTWLLLHPS